MTLIMSIIIIIILYLTILFSVAVNSGRILTLISKNNNLFIMLLIVTSEV